tara:strand:- start:377 stop:676 length:300 start_codon:yes stop_codon:yes gene_type:complete
MKNNQPWSGWSNLKPKNKKQRQTMKKKCGTKCFLGPKLSYPICKKNTCKIAKSGIWSAYIRGMQWSKRSTKKGMSKKTHKNVARKARFLIDGKTKNKRT